MKAENARKFIPTSSTPIVEEHAKSSSQLGMGLADVEDLQWRAVHTGFLPRRLLYNVLIEIKSLDAQIASDFYAAFQPISRRFGCDLAERSATPNR